MHFEDLIFAGCKAESSISLSCDTLQVNEILAVRKADQFETISIESIPEQFCIHSFLK